MRWPWHRDVTTDPAAHEAVRVQEEKLRAQEERQDQVDQVTQRLVDRRRQNRFAELVEEAIRLRREQM